MEKQNKYEYGEIDPDIIDQNTPVNDDIQSLNHIQKKLTKKNRTEFGKSDPDYIDQNTLVDHDDYEIRKPISTPGRIY
jgi:hypothetical protein